MKAFWLSLRLDAGDTGAQFFSEASRLPLLTTLGTGLSPALEAGVWPSTLLPSSLDSAALQGHPAFRLAGPQQAISPPDPPCSCPSCSLTSHHPLCAQDLDVARAPGASGHGGPEVQGWRQSQQQRVQCRLRESQAGGEAEAACSGWVRAGPGRGSRESRAGHRGPDGRGCSVTCDAHESPGQSFWQKGKHTETYMNGQNPVRALVSPCVKCRMRAELPGVVSKDTDCAKLSGQNQAK